MVLSRPVPSRPGPPSTVAESGAFSPDHRPATSETLTTSSRWQRTPNAFPSRRRVAARLCCSILRKVTSVAYTGRMQRSILRGCQAGAAGRATGRTRLTPKVGSRALALRPGEVSRSVALSPDKQRFVLGTEWYLRAFDGDGNPLWEQRTPAAAWAVNISPATAGGFWLHSGMARFAGIACRTVREQLSLVCPCRWQTLDHLVAFWLTTTPRWTAKTWWAGT
jgi:hypothetical protein